MDDKYNKRKRRSVIWKIEKCDLQNMLDTSNSYSEVLSRLDLCNKGNNLNTLKQRIVEDQLSIAMLLRNRRNTIFSRPHLKRFCLERVLTENSSYNRHSLKRRLINNGVLQNQCSVCGCPAEWCGKYLCLVLDHINGISNDNRLENLRLLCPNCNSQTDTFAGRNKKYNINNYPNTYIEQKRTDSESQKSLKLKPVKVRISDIDPQWRHRDRVATRKCNHPAKEDLAKLLWEKPTLEIAKDFGVSDVAVAKWAKRMGLVKPPRGYWRKKECGKL